MGGTYGRLDLAGYACDCTTCGDIADELALMHDDRGSMEDYVLDDTDEGFWAGVVEYRVFQLLHVMLLAVQKNTATEN